MARSWSTVRHSVVEAGLIDEQKVTNARKELHEAVRAQHLVDLRKEQGSTQVQVARTIGVTQGYVSRLERGDLAHTELGTLESYVEALGGRLRVTVEIGDAIVTLH
ncbi:helix-turn-helix domain-containing protein [uncultured Friedmanniella sp.]|uniref:helix-turn-helix domain-containing protein n=1 Tax=uncultured Friedmanniella sp. TaxID=335381 RepID=UPI0035CA5F17